MLIKKMSLNKLVTFSIPLKKWATITKCDRMHFFLGASKLKKYASKKFLLLIRKKRNEQTIKIRVFFFFPLWKVKMLVQSHSFKMGIAM